MSMTILPCACCVLCACLEIDACVPVRACVRACAPTCPPTCATETTVSGSRFGWWMLLQSRIGDSRQIWCVRLCESRITHRWIEGSTMHHGQASSAVGAYDRVRVCASVLPLASLLPSTEMPKGSIWARLALCACLCRMHGSSVRQRCRACVVEFRPWALLSCSLSVDTMTSFDAF
jgi:hypothetical protein